MIAYQSSGYNCPDGDARWTYYGIGGTPYVQIDGSWHQEVGGLAYPGTMYPYYRAHFDTRKLTSSPLTIALTCNYDTIANTGTVNATITNTTSSAVSGTLQFTIIENGLLQNWGPTLTTIEHVCRDMLPDANGEAITVPASGNIVRSRNFTIAGTWNEKKVNIVVFVQSASDVYQANQIVLVPNPDMEYNGLTFTETSGNGNRIAQPGEGIRLYIKGKNAGNIPYLGPASISTTDPYMTITSSTPQTVNISPMNWDTILVTNVNISPSCPTPRMVYFLLTFSTGDTCTVRFIVTNQPGFVDNIEAGQGSWTHSGTGDNWHITTHRSHSATHSWYCGVENTWQYTNNNDASLVTPYFVVTPDSGLKFWYWNSMESGYDFGFVDLDNNCGHYWQNLGSYNAAHTTWTQENISVANYYGQTVRIRFRFTSDVSVVDEGWYIDDFQAPNMVAVEENRSENRIPALSVSPNPFHSQTVIRWQVNDNGKLTTNASLRIYDIAGRIIKTFFNPLPAVGCVSSVNWDGSDLNGDMVASGIYFIQLESDGEILTEKVLLLK